MLYKFIDLINNIITRVKLYNKKVHLNLTVSVDKRTDLEGSNDIKKYTNIKGSKIGFGTYIGEHCNLNNSKVGKYCSIANNVSVIVSDHPTHLVSTHPCFHKGNHIVMKKIGLSFNTDYSYSNSNNFYNVEIGSDVWIGDSVKILNNVVIGDGAIIGTGAIVTKNIPAYSICVGVPAKVIKYRFNEDVIRFFIKNKWWDKEYEEIVSIQELFLDIDSYIKNQKNINHSEIND